MRISTLQIFNQGTSSMMENQTALASIQNKLSSGKNFTTLAEDPVGANQVVTLKREMAQLDMYQSNIDATRGRLSQEETSLKEINNVLDRARELIIQSRNGTMADSERSIIAYEIETVVDYAAGLMNVRDAKGEYLFSGSKGTTQTYVLEGDRYVYQGDSTTREIQTASATYTQSSDNGEFLFEVVPGAPTLSTLGGLNEVVSDFSVTDLAAAKSFFRTTGDLRLELSGSATVGYQYTLRDSSGNLALDGTGAPLADGVTYDPTVDTLLTIPGADLTLNLPDNTEQGFGVSGVNTTGLTATESVIINSDDAYTALMRSAGGSVSIKSVGDGGAPETFSYKAYDANGVELVGVVVNGATNPIELQMDIGTPAVTTTALTITRDAVAASGTPDITLDFVPPAQATLRFAQPTDNILNTLLDVADLLRTPADGDPVQSALLSDGLALGLDQVTASQERLGEVTATLGSRMKGLDDSEYSVADFKLLVESTLSAVEDLDYAAASTELARRQLALQASFSSFAKIQNLSLFNYI